MKLVRRSRKEIHWQLPQIECHPSDRLHRIRMVQRPMAMAKLPVDAKVVQVARLVVGVHQADQRRRILPAGEDAFEFVHTQTAVLLQPHVFHPDRMGGIRPVLLFDGLQGTRYRMVFRPAGHNAPGYPCEPPPAGPYCRFPFPRR